MTGGEAVIALVAVMLVVSLALTSAVGRGRAKERPAVLGTPGALTRSGDPDAGHLD